MLLLHAVARGLQGNDDCRRSNNGEVHHKPEKKRHPVHLDSFRATSSVSLIITGKEVTCDYRPKSGSLLCVQGGDSPAVPFASAPEARSVTAPAAATAVTQPRSLRIYRRSVSTHRASKFMPAPTRPSRAGTRTLTYPCSSRDAATKLFSYRPVPGVSRTGPRSLQVSYGRVHSPPHAQLAASVSFCSQLQCTLQHSVPLPPQLQATIGVTEPTSGLTSSASSIANSLSLCMRSRVRYPYHSLHPIPLLYLS